MLMLTVWISGFLLGFPAGHYASAWRRKRRAHRSTPGIRIVVCEGKGMPVNRDCAEASALP